MKKYLLLMLCLGLFACCNGNTKSKKAETKTANKKDCVEVLYFHGKQRCATCMAIEKNATEAIETQFADELKNGTVVFKTMDISLPENEAVADKYEVTWSSLVLCKWKDGKETYENLTEYAFANARNAPDTFRSGVIEKVGAMLK